MLLRALSRQGWARASVGTNKTLLSWSVTKKSVLKLKGHRMRGHRVCVLPTTRTSLPLRHLPACSASAP